MDLDVLTDAFFDGTRLHEGRATIRLRGGRIAAIDRGEPVDDQTARVDARGQLVLPGLVNAHVHIARGGMFEPTEPIGVRQVIANFEGALAAGVTTVGDMGCSAPLARALRAHVAAHPAAGPQLVACGPVLTAPRGYPLDWLPPLLVRLGVALPCGSPDEGARAAAQVARAGMDHVKIAIMHTSYANRPLPAVSPPVARAVVDEAHRLGLRVLAHAHGIADYDVALGAGVDALMHSSFEPLDRDLVARVRDAGIPVCPTLWVFESACLGAELRFDGEPRFASRVTPAIRRSWTRFADAYAASGDVLPPGIAGGAEKTRVKEAIRVAAANLVLLRDAGVPIAFGNDANYGFSLVARPVDELAAMQRAGLSAEECLRAATSGAAALLARPDRGAIAEGKRADLVVVDREAMKDVARLERVREVIAGGRRVSPTRADRARTGAAMVRGLARTALEGLVG